MIKQYLLGITRNTRLERPSETIIKDDAEALRLGKISDVTQDLTKDNFFHLEGDATLETLRVLSTMEFSPAKLGQGSGWRIVEYPHSQRWTDAVEMRSIDTVDEEGDPITIYADAQVQWQSNTTSGVSVFTGADAYSEAQTFIVTLGDSDGYVLIDELQNNTQVIRSEPSLWKSDEERTSKRQDQGRGSPNLIGRNDYDRF